MMIANNFTNGTIYGVSDEEAMCSTLEQSSSHTNSFLYNLSILKDRVHQVQSLATMFLAPDHESTSIAIPTMGTLVQEIIATASSMMYACQQMSLGSPSTTNSVVESQAHKTDQSNVNRGFYTNNEETIENTTWYGETYNDFMTNNITMQSTIAISTSEYCSKEDLSLKVETNEGLQLDAYDIVELDAADILAKYTHYCHVCGKGFKRDANLRMHMRAHGDEYKSKAALSNPLKKDMASGENASLARKYSCPQQGCRWNKNHTKFQPLKSMICVKNHYKRSHCPKMYVCKRCSNKQFSVLSDLRTHEKHCGDLKWQCSCRNTFSRKDKLMGHVALFLGHAPVNVPLRRVGKDVESTMQMQ